MINKPYVRHNANVRPSSAIPRRNNTTIIGQKKPKHMPKKASITALL